MKRCRSLSTGPVRAVIRGADAPRGLGLDAWEGVLAGSRDGEAVIPFDAERSLLLGRTTRMAGGPHPRELGSDGFSEDEVGLIRDWIDESARSPPGIVPYTHADHPLYVANQGVATVTVSGRPARTS